jgi:hypothetical protein
MYTRLVTKDDIPAWLALAHEVDHVIGGLIPDISVFYKGFDDYMKTKIKKNEALVVVDSNSEKCMGMAAYSRKNNRITFLGVCGEADFREVGGKLLETVLSKLDSSREITASLIKSDDDIIRKERRLYEENGFIEDEAEVVESGVPACLMKRPPS